MIEKIVQFGFVLFIGLGALIAVRLFFEGDRDEDNKTKKRGGRT